MVCSHKFERVGAYRLFHPILKNRITMFGSFPKVIGSMDVFFCCKCGVFKSNIINFYKLEKNLISKSKGVN